MLKRASVTVLSAGAAHALAWGVGLWMAFGPVYHGVSVPATTAGEPAGDATRHTLTLVEANGLWVLWLLLIPVVMSGLALVAIAITMPGWTGRKALLWTPTLALLVFCVVGIFSIGLFYLPALVALLIAVGTDSLKGSTDAESQESG